jgi:hypothetical protein
MDVNIMPQHLAYTPLGYAPLRPSDKLLKSCPLGHILKFRGIASVVPLTIDKIKVNLDFHIVDILDFDLLLGYPLEKLLDASQGSLDEKLREITSTTATSRLENPLVKPNPEQNLLEKVMYGSPFISSELVLFKAAKPTTCEEYDSEEILHLGEDERSSSPSIEFEPFPAGPEYVVLDCE